MFKRNNDQLNETASAWIKSLPNYFKNVLSKLKDKQERTLKISEVMKKAKESTNDPEERKEVLDLINKLRDELPPIQITEGDVTMASKRTNLDMFLEGIESVEVSKKPKFHSIYRLYEAKEEDLEDKEEVQENEDCDEDDKEEMDEVIVNEKKDDEDEGDEAEGEDHEAGESEDDEAAEKEAGDEDEEGGADEEPETDDEGGEDKEAMDEGLGDVYDAIKNWLNTNPAEAKRLAAMAKNKAAFEKAMSNIVSFADKPLAAAPATARGQYRKDKAEAEKEGWIGEADDEMDEGSQGYAAGLKGVRKDAGAKKLKSGANKVPAPKVQITGDKKLLKKPTVAKGDTYPKSSVAGAARPGAPKVKKS